MTKSPNPPVSTSSGAGEGSSPGLRAESAQIPSSEEGGSSETSDSESGRTPSELQPKASSPFLQDGPPQEGGAAAQAQWHAIWSPAHGAYYFYNPSTNETTWVNPLAPEHPVAEGSIQGQTDESTSASSPQPASTQIITTSKPTSLIADALGGIDPELAFLDPSLAQAPPSTTPSYGPTFTAKFSARTGKFSGASSRDPSHVSEYERAKRMSEAYFDVETWQKEITERDAAKKRAAEEAELTGTNPNQKRKPTKADIARWKEAKKEKKLRKTAWLRE